MAGLAEKMFWRSPELVDNLINFLEVESVAELAKAYPFTAELLESSKKTWGGLVQRSCPFYQHKGLPVEEGDHGWADHTYRPGVEDRLAEQHVNVFHLTRILSSMESPKVPLLELLHVICERFPLQGRGQRLSLQAREGWPTHGVPPEVPLQKVSRCHPSRLPAP